jgi:hypothetical protein
MHLFDTRSRNRSVDKVHGFTCTSSTRTFWTLSHRPRDPTCSPLLPEGTPPQGVPRDGMPGGAFWSQKIRTTNSVRTTICYTKVEGGHQSPTVSPPSGCRVG